MEYEGRPIPESELLQQSTPEELAQSSEQGQSHLSLEEFEARIKERLDLIPDVGYRFYKDEEKRSKFKNETETLCRNALARQADVIVFFDQSARGYGLLTKELLPIMELEYAKLKSSNLDELKLPQIIFINPPRGGWRKQFPQELVEKTRRTIEGKRVLFFDESSDNDWMPNEIYKYTPSEQYDYFASDAWRQVQESIGLQNRESLVRRHAMTTSRNVMHSFQNAFPNSEFEVQVGPTSLAMGSDHVASLTYKTGKTNVRQALWGIDGDDITETDHSIEGLAVPHEVTEEEKEKLREMGYESVREAQEQLRNEFKMIAKESLDRVVTLQKGSETE